MMFDMTAEPAKITARELTRNASRVLDRVEHGERLTVTRDGEPIAEIIPIDPSERLMARWIREGIVAPPPPGGYAKAGDLARASRELLASQPEPDEPGSDRTLTEILMEMREAERF
jgi:prevent-host-death family protein